MDENRLLPEKVIQYAANNQTGRRPFNISKRLLTRTSQVLATLTYFCYLSHTREIH